MQEFIEREISLSGVSVLIGTSEWSCVEDWVCPPSSYVVCQRLSDGHSPLQLMADRMGPREVYSRVGALGFMPSTGCITLSPLGHPLRTLNCFFDKAYFEAATEIDAPGWLGLVGSFLPVSNGSLDALMQRIHRELVEPGFGSAQAIEAASVIIAVEMARLGQKHLGGPEQATQRLSGVAPWQLRRIRDRVAASLGLGYPRVQELAELCGVSSSHLMRTFKASTGWSLHRYIADERLHAARRMLAEDRLAIKEVAAMLGFCNTGHFTNAFRRLERMTPSEFRARARAEQASTNRATSRRECPNKAADAAVH